jgi:hypothetical protein
MPLDPALQASEGQATMGTLASELAPHAERLSGQPRVYVDANVPAPLVAFMRQDLHWDALFVIEHDDLRRAPDGEHYRIARQLGRTLITFDRDYLNDVLFPPERSGGVIVMSAPGERGFMTLLARLDRQLLRGTSVSLTGRKLHVHVDWTGV